MAEENEHIYVYALLPKEVRAFFLDSGLEDIDEIGKIYGMSQAAVDVLDEIQQDILFGYNSLDSIENLIKERLGLDSAITRKVALEMIRRRFLPIDSYMGARAFSTYANLGGDPAIVNVKRIDAAGGTVVDIKRLLDQEVSNILVDRAQKAASAQAEPAIEIEPEPELEPKPELEPEPLVSVPELEPEPEIVLEPVVSEPEPELAPLVSEPETEPMLEPEPELAPEPTTPELKVEPVVEAAPILEPEPELAPKPKPQPVVEPVVEAAPARKVEPMKEPSDPFLDSEQHELAPPPPAIIDESPLATRKDVGPMVIDKAVEDVKDDEPIKKQFARKPISEVVVTPKKVEPKKELFPDVSAEAQGASTLRNLEGTGKSAPKSLESSRIDEVQRKLTLAFPSQELDKRFRVVLGARLSGVRSTDDFRKSLAGDITKGGLGLDEHTITRVMEEVEGKKATEEQEAMAKHALGKDKMVKDAQAKYGAKPAVGAPVPAPGLAITSSTDQKQSTAKTVLSDASVQKASSTTGKTQIMDVLYKKRLVGPIDEFRRMNLDDFRRLPGDIETAHENLMTDINTLGGKDPGLRIRAIEAWRHSPLVALYQRIIGAALQRGVPIEDVLGDKELNPKGMTKEELNAVRKMNTVLRY